MKKRILAIVIGLIMLVVCVGGVIALIPVGLAAARGDVHFGLLSVPTISAEAQEEKNAPVSGPADLTVHTPMGTISITAVSGATAVTVQAHKVTFGSSQAEADLLLQKLQVTLVQAGNVIHVDVAEPVEVDLLHIGPAKTQVDFTITVPEGSLIHANSASGDITLGGRTASADLHSNFGEVRASDVEGDVTARSDSGKVTVDGAQAPQGTIEATSSFGDVLVQNSSAGSLTVHSNSGRVTIHDTTVTNTADVSTNFGDVQVYSTQAGTLTAKTSSGHVDVNTSTVDGPLTATSNFGDVTVETTNANRYDLSTNSGKVEGSGLGGAVRAHSNFGDVVLAGEGVTLDASTNSGSVTFTGSLGEGESALTSQFGDITVSLPASAQFSLDLKTSFGSVHSAFAVTATSSSGNHLAGKVGAGGPTLQATTNSGNVNVNIQPNTDAATATP